MRKERLLSGRPLIVFLRKRGVTFVFINRKIPGIFLQSRKIGMTILFCLLSTTAYAECTPAPDCASIGYTETSCETTSLKCPFDTSKLYCLPCDSKYQYTCSGDNITGGVGSTCNGKYASCECGSGFEWNDNSCEEKPDCTVGMIYYSNKYCSTVLDSTKTAIGIVIKDNELIMNELTYMSWSSSLTDTSLTNMLSSQAIVDMNGKSNTATIVATHTSLGETISTSAAIYCNEYSTDGTNTGDWYLPAAGELYSYIYGNYNVINTTMSTLGWIWGEPWLWSSSEKSNGIAWYVHSSGGMDDSFGKNKAYSVACFLDIR